MSFFVISFIYMLDTSSLGTDIVTVLFVPVLLINIFFLMVSIDIWLLLTYWRVCRQHSWSIGSQRDDFVLPYLAVVYTFPFYLQTLEIQCLLTKVTTNIVYLLIF